MKKKVHLLFALLVLIAVPQVYAVTDPTTPVNSSDSTEIPRSESAEEIVSITGKSRSELVYFKLLIKNESKASVFSMVREYPNGEFESVEVKFGVVNRINTPILYTFLDRDVPDRDFTYVLYRITDTSEVLKKWDYCSNEKELCEHPSEMIALK